MAKGDGSSFPSSSTKHPIVLPDGSAHLGTVFLQPVIDHPRFEVGRFTYASSFTPPDDWAARLAPHLFEFSPEKLVIGKFCQIADGAIFITASANHRYDGFSSYPFAVFGGGPIQDRPSMPGPGADTHIGNDVWIGQNATVLPGARIGNGAIIGAGAVVGGNVPDYAIMTGNPATLHRMRFSAAIVERLNQIAWWDWPIETIIEHEAQIVGADLEALERASTDTRNK